MATVPGTPMQDTTGGIPRELQPTQADMLMAAAIMHQQGRMQLAGDVVPIKPGGQPFTYGATMPAGYATSRPSTDDPGYRGALVRGVLGGSVKVLKPTPGGE
jgi:hypothetical protein